MKKTRAVIKCIAIVAALAVVFGALFLLAACNKNKAKTVDDIYKSASSPAEFTDIQWEFNLPAGWSVLTDPYSATSANKSDTGYISELNGFVVRKGSVAGAPLSIRLCGSEKAYYQDGEPGMLFPDYLGITALSVGNGFIACKFNDGTAGVFDYNGRTVLSSSKLNKTSSTSVTLDSMLKVLGGGLIAVHSNYDINGENGYTSIYRPYYNSSNLSDCGKLVCRVANSANNLSYVLGFEGKYVSVTGNSDGIGLYRIPDDSTTVRNLNGNDNLSLLVSSNGKSNYKSEVTYIGGGKFYISEDWTVDKSDDYTYYDGSKYYVVQRRIYRPDRDSVSDFNSDKIFMQLTNNYYDGGKIEGFDTSSYLKDGYTYVAYGLTVVNKLALYDQFILDSDLNIVMSLTGNFGITLDEKRDEVGTFDLILFNMDGYSYVPYYPSEVAIYKGSEKVGSNKEFTTQIVNQELCNGILIAAIIDATDSTGTSVLYGAFDVYGNKIIDFKYNMLSAFRGNYSIARRYDEDKGTARLYIIGSDGKEITSMSDGSTPLADIVNAEGGGYVYKVGCYMFSVKDAQNNRSLYGIKNFNPDVRSNVIMEARMQVGSVLYSPNSSPQDVFVFEKLGTGASPTWTVYRLV